jgi:hypothetical protein
VLVIERLWGFKSPLAHWGIMKRGTSGVAVAVLLGTIGLSFAAPNAANAASGITFVAGPDRFVVNVSSNGQFVLTAGEFDPTPRVVDRRTGTSVDVPGVVQPFGDMRISGDGTRVVFSSEAQFLPADTDAFSDVYSVVVATGALTLLTAGDSQQWDFFVLGGTNELGSKVLVRGTNGALGRVAPFVGDGVTTRELASTLTNATSAAVYGMTVLGDQVMYASNGGCGASACLTRSLYVEDISDPLDVQIRLVGQKASTSTSFTLADAAMSPDGSYLIARESGTGVVYTGSTSIPNTLVPRNTSATGALFLTRSVAIANGGTTFAFLETTASDGMQAVLREGQTDTAVSSPPGGSPNAGAISVVLSADASAVFFTSLATNLIDAPVIGYNVYARGTSNPAVDFNASYFTPRTPVRILDTRVGLGYSGSRPAVGTSIVVPVRGLYDVPDDATAVAVQLTAADGNGVGYVSAFPTSAEIPATSNLNLDTPGETIANMAIVPIGSDGSITVYAAAPTHVIVDLMGWWNLAGGPVRGGRYSAVGPNRILDTRPESAVNWDQPKPAAGSITVLHVAGQSGVPATGVSAVVINVTLVDPSSPGFVQAAPASELVVGSSSTLNVSTAGQVIAAATIVPVDSSGNIAIYMQPSTHLVVDLGGWFTDSTAAVSPSGLFVPLVLNRREADTRVGVGFHGPTSAGTRFDVGLPGGALVGNVTVTENAGAGYVQLGPAAAMVNGSTSTINVTQPGETIANAFIVPLDNGLGVFTSIGTQVIVDSSGFMTP